MELFDTHAHLDDAQFDGQLDEIVLRASAAGIVRIVTVGTTAESSAQAVELAARYGYWEPNYYGMDRSDAHPTQVQEIAAAVSGLIWKQRIKWIAEYSHRWLQKIVAGGKPLDGTIKVHTIQAQAQLAF